MMSSRRTSPMTTLPYWHEVPGLAYCKKRRRSPRGCVECDDTTHFIADCPKRKKLDCSNKNDYTNRNDYSKEDNNKNWFGRL
jgi:hypothetical protein